MKSLLEYGNMETDWVLFRRCTWSTKATSQRHREKRTGSVERTGQITAASFFFFFCIERIDHTRCSCRSLAMSRLFDASRYEAPPIIVSNRWCVHNKEWGSSLHFCRERRWLLVRHENINGTEPSSSCVVVVTQRLFLPTQSIFKSWHLQFTVLAVSDLDDFQRKREKAIGDSLSEVIIKNKTSLTDYSLQMKVLTFFLRFAYCYYRDQRRPFS